MTSSPRFGRPNDRKVAARLIQDFPEVVEPLRQGKLCLPGAANLARVMTPENRDEVLHRFFHRSRPRPGGLEVRTRSAAGHCPPGTSSVQCTDGASSRGTG